MALELFQGWDVISLLSAITQYTLEWINSISIVQLQNYPGRDWYSFPNAIAQLFKDEIDTTSLQWKKPYNFFKDKMNSVFLVRLHNLPWKWST
jgi:hypothetical protein